MHPKALMPTMLFSRFTGAVQTVEAVANNSESASGIFIAYCYCFY
jgi:hypothetical protein